MTKPRSNHFIDFGLYYGYPTCCIVEFISFIRQYKPGIKRGKRKFHGTGYVPCKSCNKKSKKEILNYIESHRKCVLPFPQQCD